MCSGIWHPPDMRVLRAGASQGQWPEVRSPHTLDGLLRALVLPCPSRSTLYRLGLAFALGAVCFPPRATRGHGHGWWQHKCEGSDPPSPRQGSSKGVLVSMSQGSAE